MGSNAGKRGLGLGAFRRREKELRLRERIDGAISQRPKINRRAREVDGLTIVSRRGVIAPKGAMRNARIVAKRHARAQVHDPAARQLDPMRVWGVA